MASSSSWVCFGTASALRGVGEGNAELFCLLLDTVFCLLNIIIWAWTYTCMEVSV